MCNIYRSAQSELRWNKVENNLRHFRTFNEILENSDLCHTGVEGHALSGSGQFTNSQLFLLADRINQIGLTFNKIIIIDTRMESHGFINGLPMEWKAQNSDFDPNKTASKIAEDEKSRLADIFQQCLIKDKRGNEIRVNETATEEELVSQHKFQYIRLPILDHSRPSDQVVDAFLEVIKNYPESWLHIHCHVGKGRTTTLMVLYDMFYNAKHISFEHILERHRAIGGEDFKKHPSGFSWNQERKKLPFERLEFLENFYRYCCEVDPKHISWQAWLQASRDSN